MYIIKYYRDHEILALLTRSERTSYMHKHIERKI